MNIQPASVMVEGRPVRGVTVTCRCGVTTPIPVNTISGTATDQESQRNALVARKLEAKGWKVLKNKDGHSCPGCVARYDATDGKSKIVVKDFKDMKTNVTTLPLRMSEEPPVDLDRLNRRIILAKLEEVYEDEKTGYSPGWTDAKVAADLGVPRAWVTMLRNDNFGPEGNEEIRIKLEEAKASLAETKASLAEILEAIRETQRVLAMVPQLQRALPELQRTATDIQRKIDKTEKTIIDVEKELRA